ncbi:hypothetical protein J2799_003008 [Chryseobacterium vietnamense]|uniref:hypothetical protein n=1 Tax=Chryseobacterium vietnamense TaxID=866785 RepID=UPI0028598D2C|nr:hypothetical protein [Chryseobacterium vietnamense]MDR6488490.1 hypothetical protein [Chryseobacterium vietnamense]
MTRTDFDASTHDKKFGNDKTFTLDWGSFVVPSTFPANGSKGGPTWAGRVYAGTWVLDRIADLKNTLSGGDKPFDTIYLEDYTFKKNSIVPIDTTYKTIPRKGETSDKARERLYKTADSLKSSK